MDTKKLRQKILDLAIHGKLVPQDPNDEPASVLLERIRAEKERLISEGKIKRSRKTVRTTDTHHYEQDVPFEVPQGWVWTTLGEIGNWQSGATPSRMQKEYYEGTIPWLKTGDLNDGLITEIPEKITEKALEETSVRLNPSGSVLIAMYGATIGKVGILTYPATTNQACCACIDYKINQMFLFYYLLANRETFVSIGGGGTQPNISKEKIVSFPLPLPPLAEQHRIVAEIERWFTLVDTIEQGKENLGTSIKQAKSKILDLAIHGKLVQQNPNDEPASELLKRINPKAQITCDNEHSRKLPKGWYNTTLANMCNTTNGLWKGKKPPFVKVGVIRNANFTKYFTLDYSKIEYIDVEQRAFEKKHLLHGDLIVEKSGGSDKNPVGRAIFFDGEDGLFSFSNFTMCLRCKDQTTLMSKYLFYLLLCIYSRGDMVAMQTQTTGLHNLLVEKFMAMTFPLPPFAEQKRIVQKIEELFSLLDCIEKALQA
ncbi:restriction endonuclease subunit S [Prevotella denticola]|uniref:restriction endonuclease subunit S n=1 Tax=Prevotella denticola TaxID=28129 RepID=UPI001C5F7649|nr:restriction endonuclease subunit S [Prevotella denticola]MBW4898481.1 restriction endonuclease subunit S [Prevotella denticola]